MDACFVLVHRIGWISLTILIVTLKYNSLRIEYEYSISPVCIQGVARLGWQNPSVTSSPPIDHHTQLTMVSFEPNRTESRCTTEKAKGTHVFEIDGYNLKKGLGVGRFVRSATFAVGGFGWAIRFYPDGADEDSEDYVCAVVELMNNDDAESARVFFDLGLADHGPKSDNDIVSMKEPIFFMNTGPCGGIQMERTVLEESIYIQDDRLKIMCVLTVLREERVYEIRGGSSEIEVPPSDMAAHLGKMLRAKEGADVAFSVGPETFEAHRTVLAARSPVFRAELCLYRVPTMETTMTSPSSLLRVAVEDMQPAVFRALLHFIYTDSLPADLDGGDLEGNDDDRRELIRHLLVAADRYAMERLKMMCQRMLAKDLDIETVATTLALADRHSCGRLKDACVEFIASLHEMDAVVATKGYANLKRSCPNVLVDVFEKISRHRKA